MLSGPGSIAGDPQGCAIEELDLADARDVVEREQLMHLEVGPRLLPRFPRRGGLGALVQFHEAGRQGPVADARRDRPAAQQHLVLPHGHGTDDDLRVVVVDETAVGADQPLALVALRDLPDVRPHILVPDRGPDRLPDRGWDGRSPELPEPAGLAGLCVMKAI